MKSLTKSPRKECSKNIRSNQNAIRCAKCDTWVHVKCLPMTKVMFQYYLAHPNEEWLCDSCGLPSLSDSYFNEDMPQQPDEACDDACEPYYYTETGDYDSEPESSFTWFETNINSYYKSNLKIGDININGIYNKMDEVLEMVNKKMYILFHV